MTRPELTPGEGGGKPAKPKPLFPWLLPQPRPQPEPEPEVTSVTPMVNIVPNKPLTPAQQSSGKPRPATSGSSPVLVPPDILDINPDAVGSLEQHIVALYDRLFVSGSAQPIDQTSAQVTGEYESTPLTQGQAEQVDYLLTEETDSLAREVLITLKRDGIPPRREWNDFMAQYALFSWDTESDAQAWATLALIAESDWDETTAFADEDHVEAVAQDLGDNAIEGLVVIDAETRDTLFDRTGVVRADGSQYVGMQDTEADALRAEALSGRKLIFVHNHTEEVGASDEDLDSAFRAGAELLIVITPSGREQVFVRGRGRMVLVRDEQASYKVGLENPEETKELRIRSEAQAWAFQHDSPEYIFLEEDEPLWWQRGNIFVPYNTTETTRQVAARMGIPADYLQQLNATNMLNGVMYIPLPGWYTQMVHEPSDSRLSAIHASGATLMDLDSVPLEDHLVLSEIDQLILLWKSLSPVEQQIEMALIGSNAGSRTVPFANRYDFDYTLTWIHDREDTFKQAASDFDIPVALLQTVIQAELLYDYDTGDQLQDFNIRANFNNAFRQILGRLHSRARDSWDGAGVANVHYPTLIDAYRHGWSQLKPGGIHPWHLPYLDGEKPDLSAAPRIYVSDDDIAKHYGVKSVDGLEEPTVATRRFSKRMERLHEVPWDLRDDIAHYLADDVGSIRAAAMVTKMYSDELREFDSDANIEGNTRDMARVWGRYRSSEEYFDYAGNARLAHPLADYWSNRENEEKAQ